ncbi:MAG: hypothetical protein ACI4PO_11920 [Faecousia sp.]
MEEKDAVLDQAPIPVVEEPAPAVEKPAPAAEEPAVPAAEAAPAGKQPRKYQKPHVAIRILMQLLSLLLSLVLLFGVISAALVADLRQVTAKDGIKQILVTLLQGPATVRPAVGAVNIRLDSASEQSSSQVLDALVDMAMEYLATMEGLPEELDENALRSEVEAFLNESTLVDFLTDKVAGYTSDYLTGEALTTITPEEIRQLVEENKEVIQNRFGIEITREQTDAIVRAIEEVDIDTAVRKEVFESIDRMPLGGPSVRPEDPDNPALSENSGIPQNLTVGELVRILQQISSDSVMAACVGFCAVLVLLLLLCNFYSIPGGLGWASAPTIFAGLLLSLPIFWIQGNPETLTMLVNGEPTVANVIAGLASTLAPVHFAVLGIGIALAAASIAARVIRSVMRKRKAI